MKRSVFIFFFLCGILISTDFSAQSGGRRREHRNQRKSSGGMFKSKHSAGNADRFARGGGRKGGKSKAWAMRHSRPGSYSSRDSRTLFSRYRTKGKVYRHNILAKQNADRSRKRVRGNKVFHRKKFF